MGYCTVRYITVVYSTVQYNTVQYSTIHYTCRGDHTHHHTQTQRLPLLPLCPVSPEETLLLPSPPEQRPGVLVLHFSTFRNKIHLNQNYEIHFNENYEIWKICHIFGNFYIIKKNDDGKNFPFPFLEKKKKEGGKNFPFPFLEKKKKKKKKS